jgi:sec-independent protein translocase protein TatA
MGGMEIVLILAVVLLFFGGSKLPGLARGFGQSIKEFKKGMKEDPNAGAKVRVEKTTVEK